MGLIKSRVMKGRSMDDDAPLRRWTPRIIPVGAAGTDGQEQEQEQESRFRATATRVRAQAVKAAAVARPHLGPIVATFAAVAVSSLVSSALDRDRPSDQGVSPSPQCRPAGGGPSSTCQECGRPLTDELSRQAGYGPTCARYKLL
ncbi:DUF6011 domain-containing protein [Streptomyces sp. WELS2]|uniref:DUF6011 domain-containing protein n=1 Tax=Streptomyces sp. WELS2 TaxID=2749435 RepID=UPI0015F0AD1F|nr:DUF6011 domain-containing protein [Streptomyces sp. WELS2]